jgi:hypothetical protein
VGVLGLWQVALDWRKVLDWHSDASVFVVLIALASVYCIFAGVTGKWLGPVRGQY